MVPPTRSTIAQEYSKQCATSWQLERVSSPPETMMQASVVAGIMACCGELVPCRESLKVLERQRGSLTSNLTPSSTRGSVSESRHGEPCATKSPKVPDYTAEPERLVTHPCPVCFLLTGRGRHVPAPAGGASRLVFQTVCSLDTDETLFCRFARAGFRGVFCEAGAVLWPLRPSEVVSREWLRRISL